MLSYCAKCWSRYKQVFKYIIKSILPRFGAVEEGKVLHESGTEWGHTGPRVGVDSGDVGDILDVMPRLSVRVIRASVINVLTHKLSRHLVVILVNLW